MIHVTAIQLKACKMRQATRNIRNGRHDLLAMNHLGRALYSPVLADPRRPVADCRRTVHYSGSTGHPKTCGCTDTGASG